MPFHNNTELSPSPKIKLNFSFNEHKLLVDLPAVPSFTLSSSPLALHPRFKCTLVAGMLYNVSNYVASVQWAYTVLQKCSVSQKSRKIAHNHSVTGL